MADIKNIAVQAGMTYGGIQNNWDALKDDFDAVAYLPFGDEYWDAMNQIMNGIGNREIAKQPSVKWFEMNRMEVPMTSNGAVTSTAAQFNITLPTGEIQTLGSSTYTWPAKNEIWRHAKSGQLFQITAKAEATPQTIGLTPLTTAGVGISIVANDKFFYVGVSVPENSTSQASKYVFDTLKTAKLQTFRHDANSSSEALYNQLWYSQLENGVQTPYSNSRDIIYLQREHQVAIVNTFLAGQETTNTTNIGAAQSFQTTNGLIPSIIAAGTQGQVVDYGTAASDITVLDFYDLEAALTKQDASVKNYMVWTTAATSQAIEKALGGGSTTVNYFANQNVQINKVEMNKTFWGEGAYADLMDRTYSFNNVVFNGKNFGLVRMGVFDNPQIFNTTDSSWSNYAIFLPMTSRGIDDGLGNMGKYIRMCHKPGAFMNMWQTGGRAAANKTDQWNLGVHIVSEIGFKFINANKYGMFWTGA